MPSFTLVFSVVALALASNGLSLEKRTAAITPCEGAQVVSSSSVAATNVQLTTYSCDAVKVIADDDVTTTATVTSTVTTTAAVPTPTSVCGNICTDYCTDLGDLPPNMDDCDEIITAIQIFDASSPTFTVNSGNMVQLTYGTCRFYFENLSTEELEYCWSDLANQSSAAAAACFPPTMPVTTLGLCTPSSGFWEVGVGHS